MSPLEATDYLRREMRLDPDIKLMVSAALTAGGHKDLFDWAEASPDQVVMVAEAAKDLVAQTAEFERRLAAGDLS